MTRSLVEYLLRHGIDPGPFTGQLEWVAGQYDQRVSQATERKRRKALASGTHALTPPSTSPGCSATGRSTIPGTTWASIPTLCDLYRWHGAEEVEHRHVSYNVAKYFGMDLLRPGAGGRVGHVVFFAMVLRGTKFLVHEDPALPKLGYLRLAWKLRASGKSGAFPRGRLVVRSALRLLQSRLQPGERGQHRAGGRLSGHPPAARALHG